MLLALLAGAWPAFVQSGFRPVNVLRGIGAAPGGGAVRQALTGLQFAMLIALGICAGVVYRQRQFAMREALRLDTDQVLMINAPTAAPHRDAFIAGLRTLPGVKSAIWGSVPLLGNTGFRGLRSRMLAVASQTSAYPSRAGRLYHDVMRSRLRLVRLLRDQAAGRAPANRQ